jgi:hypothetical protein
MSRRSILFAVPIGLILFLGILFTGLWFTERLPSDLREWIYLKAANISDKATREPVEFDFFVVGHLYGSPSIDDHLPDKLLLQRLPEIITAKPDFMVSLGDVVYQKSQTDFSNLDATFLKKLPFPLYNTPGNHDIANNPSLYESYFGKQTYFGQEYGPARLIFLNTELVECGLDEPQLEMLQQELNKAINDPETHFIFIFMHKTLVFQIPLMEKYFKPAARSKPVIIFAGDVGAWGNLSPYYQRDRWLPLTIVMTGLGDTSQDNIIRVQVAPDSVKMDALFLEDMHSAPLQEYDLNYWMDIARGQ